MWGCIWTDWSAARRPDISFARATTVRSMIPNRSGGVSRDGCLSSVPGIYCNTELTVRHCGGSGIQLLALKLVIPAKAGIQFLAFDLFVFWKDRAFTRLRRASHFFAGAKK
jgi:hypothetical protein